MIDSHATGCLYFHTCRWPYWHSALILRYYVTVFIMRKIPFNLLWKWSLIFEHHIKSINVFRQQHTETFNVKQPVAFVIIALMYTVKLICEHFCCSSYKILQFHQSPSTSETRSTLNISNYVLCYLEPSSTLGRYSRFEITHCLHFLPQRPRYYFYRKFR